MLGFGDPWEALCIDAVCADAGRAMQEHAMDRARAAARDSPIPGVIPVAVLGTL
jgi:hypothetical protein